MQQWKTYQLEAHPEYTALPPEFCLLTMVSGPNPGAVQPVGKEPLVLGRDPMIKGHIDDRGMSRQHAKIFQVAGVFFVQDMESTNGTRVNGEPLARARDLKDGDHIQLGENTVLRVSLLDAQAYAAQQKMFEAAVRDALTGVFNRGYFEERLTAEFAFSLRHKVPLAVLLLDIDFFKKVNDTHGHQTGDDALCAVAQAVQGAIRCEDVFARYGGEEFVLLARGIGSDGARQFAERLRAQIEAIELTSRAGEPVPLTTSIGYAAFEQGEGFSNGSGLVAAADRGLYQAKQSGRNRVANGAPDAPAGSLQVVSAPSETG